jgi:two-component system response regulator FixJ
VARLRKSQLGLSKPLHSTSDYGSNPGPESIPVCVVSHDPSTRDSASKLVRSAGFRVEAFASIEAWVGATPRKRRGCVILDVQDRDLIGTEQLQKFSAICARCSVVVLIDRGNVPVAVSALKVGALDVLEKPVSDELMLESVRRAARIRRDVDRIS